MRAQAGSHSFSLTTTGYKRDTLFAVKKGNAGREMKLLHVLLLLLLHSIDHPSRYNRSLLMLVDAPFGHLQQHLLMMVAAVG
jgi:hypothetical protein